MFDVVDFLEKVGQDATLARASCEEAVSRALGADLSPAERERLAREVEARLRDAPRPLCCMQYPAEEEGEEREHEPDAGESPSREGE